MYDHKHCLNYKLLIYFFSILGSIQNQLKDNPKEQRLYKKLKALNRYHKKNGEEAVLSKRVNELRVKVM